MQHDEFTIDVTININGQTVVLTNLHGRFCDGGFLISLTPKERDSFNVDARVEERLRAVRTEAAAIRPADLAPMIRDRRSRK